MGHAHDHGHDHGHAPKDFGRAFAIGVALNLGFVVVEAFYGYIAGSLALIADAGHNLSDVFGLLLAWGAAWLSRREPTSRRTYGYRRSSILAALVNAVVLLIAVGAIVWEAVRRFGNPEPIAGGTVMWVAAVGIAINTATALMFMAGRKDDINIRGAFLHMAADAAVSLGVVIAAAAIMADRLAMARSRGQPADRRGDHRRHLGPAAGFGEPGDGCGAGGDRSGGGRGLSRQPAQCLRGP